MNNNSMNAFEPMAIPSYCVNKFENNFSDEDVIDEEKVEDCCEVEQLTDLIHCIKCKNKTASIDVEQTSVKTKKGTDRNYVKAKCKDCGSKKGKFGKIGINNSKESHIEPMTASTPVDTTIVDRAIDRLSGLAIGEKTSVKKPRKKAYDAQQTPSMMSTINKGVNYDTYIRLSDLPVTIRKQLGY